MAAEAAATHCRRELPDQEILCQGDAQLGELTRTFVANPQTSLFGTLSLWQGVDVPGDTCELVIIDKIPFPRPDDPLLQARQRAVAERGGNGKNGCELHEVAGSKRIRTGTKAAIVERRLLGKEGPCSPFVSS